MSEKAGIFNTEIVLVYKVMLFEAHSNSLLEQQQKTGCCLCILPPMEIEMHTEMLL